jgi:hypothetical protein
VSKAVGTLGQSAAKVMTGQKLSELGEAVERNMIFCGKGIGSSV